MWDSLEIILSTELLPHLTLMSALYMHIKRMFFLSYFHCDVRQHICIDPDVDLEIKNISGLSQLNTLKGWRKCQAFAWFHKLQIFKEGIHLTYVMCEIYRNKNYEKWPLP